MLLLVAPLKVTRIPFWRLPEIRLRAPALVPPMKLPETAETTTPLVRLGRAASPLMSVPI